MKIIEKIDYKIERARELRTAGLVLVDIAQKLGVSTSVVHKWTSDIKKPSDLSGEILGFWRVLHQIKNTNNYKSSLYRCQCSKCGSIKNIESGNLRRGKSLSCGCERGRKPLGEAPLNRIFRSYKSAAKKRNLEFSITKELLLKLIKDSCYYCGAPPRPSKVKVWSGSYLCNGIDRVDNNKGYIVVNTVTSCAICNWMKLDLAYNDFLSKITKIYNFSVINNHVSDIQNDFSPQLQYTEESAKTLNRVFTIYENGASTRNLEFSITKETLSSLIKDTCYYCGAEPTPMATGVRNGIDRVDSSKGYTIGNVVTCCANCNRMKMHLTYNDFINKVTDVYNRMKRGV